MKDEIVKLKLSISRWLMLFMVALILSGITAFDVHGGILWLNDHVTNTAVHQWIIKVLAGTTEVNSKYPFLFYGYDWLAFAHIVIAVAFIGPYRNPIQNEWVVQFGMIACAMVIPAAFIMGAIRHIPIWWRLFDCSFGVAGFVPLCIVWFKIQQLKEMRALLCKTTLKKAFADTLKTYS